MARAQPSFDDQVMDELMEGASTVLELSLALKSRGGGVARVEAAIERLITRGLVVRIGQYGRPPRSGDELAAPIFDMARTRRVA